jgi:hypothetical protein
MKQVTVFWHDGDRVETWAGRIVDDILVAERACQEGRQRYFFILPERSVAIAVPPWDWPVPEYWAYFVHMCDARQTGELEWHVFDREIDVIVEPDCQTYRVIDLNDFADAIADGRLTAEPACRTLDALQVFLDEYLHGGGKFPPAEIARFLAENRNNEVQK